MRRQRASRRRRHQRNDRRRQNPAAGRRRAAGPLAALCAVARKGRFHQPQSGAKSLLTRARRSPDVAFPCTSATVKRFVCLI
jgi:hypothetical protein